MIQEDFILMRCGFISFRELAWSYIKEFIFILAWAISILALIDM
jgi:hypothetical protein